MKKSLTSTEHKEKVKNYKPGYIYISEYKVSTRQSSESNAFIGTWHMLTRACILTFHKTERKCNAL